MLGIFELSVFVGAVLVQLLGIASMLFARVSERSKAQHYSQRCFFGCLVLVGSAALAAVSLGSGAWLSCGITLAVMAVGATIDGGRRSEVLV